MFDIRACKGTDLSFPRKVHAACVRDVNIKGGEYVTAFTCLLLVSHMSSVGYVACHSYHPAENDYSYKYKINSKN